MAQLLASLLLLLLSIHSALALRICSFNVRSFGESKKANCNAMDVIVKVIKRCDIMLLMEIKDNNNRICPELKERLNGNSRRSITYNYVISSRLGRNTYKEQYAFLYKEKLVSVKDSYLYHDYQDGDTDVFSREPFVVWFQSPYTAVKDFVIVPLHTTPETSVKEIDELADVYMDVKRHWKAENFIFMGDFNAGCSYVPKKAWKNIRLRTDPRFIWLIGDQEDTTVKESTNCAYDRIVLRGQEIVSSVVPKSNSTFDFQKAYRLTEEEALDVSDHFPVEFKLQSSRFLTNSKKTFSSNKKKKASRTYI
ncbi:Deoxyribonuclease gamma [Camelus dromedarius]|uniref:Deoxyribonuclease n=3 Tax=Camelus TaxID=9836 RepID=A0A5N4CZC9_CAMDR|nr:deoxyribonuclease gamma [Camelus bactrianus]XP_010979221.1 deoxyribonuclease gamma [Camelus dromedarius]XP_032314091.1 deoxyribonuclease gamma [Camelus ferus]KAB1264204.1 Deoxyribonuclease gamma [Camelus dromedarius]KAB1264205.1 Deoxyribonuclease gamma [Camelus dromedarius]KAB1264206.1 Deoxyribonuclease gamma [Camelus dromedarius]